MKSIVCALLGLLAFAPAAGGDDVPPFADFAKAFFKTHFKSEKTTEMPVEKLHKEHCVHALLGVFDIAYPTWALAEKGHLDDLRALATALLQVQSHWLDWVAKGDPQAAAPKADIETLIAWVKSWKSSQFAKAETAPDKDLFVLCAASAEQSAAAKRLSALLTNKDSFGVGPRTGAPTSILFAPTRRDFVELLGYAGLVEPERKGELWTKDTPTWTSFWINWELVIALEYPAWDGDKEFKTGLSMNKFEPTGMLEHTVLHATLAFLWMCYGDGDALYLNQAQALNMAIEICGEANALEGDGGRGTTGAHTDPYEKFVPGGNSAGGTLPAIPAAPMNLMKVNQWHEGAGHDHFVGALRKGQKNGEKAVLKDHPVGLDPSVARDKNAHFQLAGNEKRVVISAPFFGEEAKKKPYPPQEVIADYKEFFRAYKSCFFWWIQTQGDKTGADASAAKWKDLLKRLAVREATKSFDELVADVYGVPLSGKNGDKESLEWRFIDWLGKGK